MYDAAYEASVVALRDAMGDNDFESAWAEGAALSAEEAIAYALRGRGERKRPTNGWASLLTHQERFAAGAPGKLPDESGLFVVEGPTWHQVLHAGGVVAPAEALLQVQLVRCIELIEIELDAQSRLVRNLHFTALDFHG